MDTDDVNQSEHTHSTEGQNVPPAPASATGIISDSATGILTGNPASETAETLPDAQASNVSPIGTAERGTGRRRL